MKYDLVVNLENNEAVYSLLDNLDVTENTRKDYKSRVGRVLSIVRDLELNRFTLIKIKQRLADIPNYSVATKNKYLATAKILFKELYKNGDLPIDISDTVKNFPQIKKHKKNGFTQREIEKITKYIKQLSNSPLEARMKAIYSLLVFQGLRQIEVVRLDVEDLNFHDETAMIQGKGELDKEAVYLHPQTVRALKEHLIVNKVSSGAVFRGLGRTGNERISTMVIKREIAKVTRELGIKKSVHGFRHYYITTLLKKLEVNEVRKFSRHKSLEMLIVYDDETKLYDKSKEVFGCFEGLDVT